MADTYHTGDIVLVNKLLTQIEKNEVICFEYPAKDSSETKTLFIQRCVALPGDTFQIINKTIFVNDFIQPAEPLVKFNYMVDTDTFSIDSLTKTRYKLFEGGRISKKGKYSYSLTKAQTDSLIADGRFKKTELRMEKQDIYDSRVFPYSREFAWNSDNFGKLYIPKEGDSLVLDTTMIKLYATMITKYENNTLNIKRDSVFINERYQKKYFVKQDYYFVVGDNRDNAIDSRRWGLLPGKYIKGQIIGTLYHKH